MSVWVYSPTTTIRAALHRHVEHLGFAVDPNPARARVVLVDLSSYASPLPPAPDAPSIALLGSDDPATVAEARESGYAAVVLPTQGPEHLRAVLAQLLGPGDAAATASAAHAGDRTPDLTQREREVLDLLMLGLTNKRIAKHLGITERTVKFHVTSLMRKHGVRKRMALMLRNPIVVTRVSGPAAGHRRHDEDPETRRP